MSQLDDLINDLEDLLEEAEGTDGVNNQSGPLSDPSKSYVATRLTDSLDKIAHALTDHLDDTGTADLSGLPSTLPGVAGWCHDEAVSAQGIGNSDDFIGSRLKSIRDAIDLDPDGYRKRTGIT